MTGSPASCPEFAPRAKFIHIDIDPAEILQERAGSHPHRR